MANSTNVTPTYRPPLGLPPGSVRGLLSLLICLNFWLLLLLPASFSQAVVPIHLYVLLVMVLLFFVAHGRSIARRDDPQPSPLWLPGGTLRFLIVAGTVAVVVWLAVTDWERLISRLTPPSEQVHNWPQYLLGALGGMVVGVLFRFVPFAHSWLAVLALLTMTAELVIEVFIFPTVKTQFDLVAWRTIVVVIVATYFASRS